MQKNTETHLRGRALATILSISMSLTVAALVYRVVRFWSGHDYVNDYVHLIAPYITYHFVDVKLLLVFISSIFVVTLLHWMIRSTGRQLLLPKYIILPLFFLVFLLTAYVFYRLASPVDRMVSATTLPDREFIALFDLQNQTLDNVRISFQSGDYEQAAGRLIKHFESKYKHHSHAVEAQVNPTQVLETADLALAHSFTIKGRAKLFPNNIRWHHGLEVDPEWVYLLNRALWFDDLITAHLLTDNRRYIDEFSNQFTDWISANKLPLWMDERSPAWRLIDTGSRPYNSWIRSFKLLINSPYIDNTTKLLMLRSLHDHAQLLFYFRTTGTNHVLIESKGLLKLADEFPEFERAKLWREIAIKRLDSEISKQVYPDGGTVELSPDYHIQSLNHFAFPLRQMSGKEIPVSSEYLGKIEAMRDFLFYSVKPNLRLPLLNDTNTKDTSEKLLREARTDQRDDLIFIATHGAEGSHPSVRSRAFENSGVYVMRSDWTPFAQYLIFDAGPYGGWHGHEDKLSFELSAYGAPMITDGGAYRYLEDDPYRKYFVSSAAHNSVLVDGLGQSRRLLKHNRKPERANEAQARDSTLWSSNDEFDFVSGIYRDGYSNMLASAPGSSVIDRSITHRRDIVYIKNDYFVVVDTLSGTGTHDVALLFHLPPDGLAHVHGESVTASYPNGATLRILSQGPGDNEISIISGQNNPIQGWFSSTDYQAVPASTVSVNFTTELPATFYTVLAPSPPPGTNKISTDIYGFKALEGQCGKSRICLEVTSSKSVDRIAFESHDSGDGRPSVSDVGESVTLERQAPKADLGIKPGDTERLINNRIQSTDTATK